VIEKLSFRKALTVLNICATKSLSTPKKKKKKKKTQKNEKKPEKEKEKNKVMRV